MPFFISLACFVSRRRGDFGHSDRRRVNLTPKNGLLGGVRRRHNPPIEIAPFSGVARGVLLRNHDVFIE